MLKKPKYRLKKYADKLLLEKFIPAAFITFLLLFIILTIIIYNSINNYRENITTVEHSHQILKIIDNIIVDLPQMHLYRRRYVITQDNKYLGEYYNKKIAVEKKFGELRDLTANFPLQLNIVQEMDSVAAASITVLDSSISDIDNTAVIDNERQSRLGMSAQDHLDRLIVIARDLKDEENNTLKLNQDKAESSLLYTQVFIISTSLFVFLVIGLSLYVSTRLIKNKDTAEKLLKKSYDELEDKVYERTAQLKTSNDNLVEEINNRIKIEKLLKESEELFRTMADSAPVLIWMSDNTNKCNYFNKGWLEFTGRELINEVGYGWTEGIHPDDLQAALETYSLAFNKREQFEIEFRLRTGTGDYRWILDRGIPRYEGNEFTGYIGICVDIHSKKRVERYLRIQYSVSKSLSEGNTMNESLNKTLESICTELGWDMAIIWIVKDNLLKIGGVWSENINAIKKYSSVFDEDYTFEKGAGLPGRVWEHKKSCWLEDIREDSNFPRKDLMIEHGWISALGFPIIGNGNVHAVIECFNRNKLTPKGDLLEVLENTGRQIGNFLERSTIEAKLKESHKELDNRVKERTLELANTLAKLLNEIEEKEKVQNKLKLFAHAVKGVKECIFITDMQNNTVFVNSAFENIFGYFEEELLDKQIPVLFSPRIDEKLREEILSGSLRGGWKGEIKSWKKDGTEFFIHLSTTVIRNDESKVQAIVGICQDITESMQQKALLEKRNSLLKLLNDVILVVNKSFKLDLSISYAINRICEYTSWDVGHCYLVKDEKLVSSKIWNGTLSSKFIEFRDISENSVFSKSEGSIGASYETGKAGWIKLETLEDTDAGKCILAARNAGLKTGIWIPIAKSGNILGVLEFFNKYDIPRDNEILDCINNISIEIGNLYERNEFVELIKERESHFKAVADSANDAIITVDSEGNILYTNRSVEKIFGYSSKELEGREMTLLMPGDLKIRHKKIFKQLLVSKHSDMFGKTIELKGKRKSGAEFPVELSISRWELKDRVYFTGMIKDISLRKKIENELLESRNSLLEAQKIARLGNWEWDIRTNEVKWSDEMFVLYELDKGSFNPGYESFISRLYPDDIEHVKMHIETACRTGQPFDFYERILTPEGKIKILRSQGGARINEKGEAIKLVGTCLDVTEIREAEEKIRENEQRLSLIMESIKDYAIFMVDEKGYIKSWNKAAKQIKGYDKEEILGKHISIFYTEEDKAKNLPEYNLKMAKLSGSYENFGWRVRKNGSLFWADILITPLYDDEGSLKGLVKVTRDITDRKMAEEALKQSEFRLKEAQKMAKMGSWEWNAVEDKVYWSDEMYNIFEIEYGTVITNDTYVDLLDNESRNTRDKVISEALAGDKTFNYYLNITTGSGKKKILNSVGEIKTGADGNILKMVGTIIDVTVIKTAEEKIKTSEKLLKEAQKIAKLGSWRFDYLDGKAEWSEEMYQIFEVDDNFNNGGMNFVTPFVHPEDVNIVERAIEKLKNDPSDMELDYRIVTKEGKLKYLTTDIKIEFGSNSRPAHLFGITQDITDIKLVESELRRANAQLVEAQKELVHNEKLAALGRFSSGIAHEIRNPLANISALAQLLSNSGIENEKMKKHLKYILINSDIANNIIKQLLHFASPEDLVFKMENPAEILNNIVDSIEPRCIENKICISRNISLDHSPVMLDKTKFENALLNFISNSIDAMPGGGNISVNAKADNFSKVIIIDIIDTGIGIPVENLDKIFEPFFTTKKSGTGLGLGLSYQTIKLHRGILNIYSENGKGTHVEIKLPIRNTSKWKTS